MAAPDREGSLGQWREKAAQLAEEQKRQTEQTVEEGYALFFDSIDDLDLPRFNNPWPRGGIYEDDTEENTRFVYFGKPDNRLGRIDERLGEFYKHFLGADVWRIGMSGFVDYTETLKNGANLRSRAVQVVVEPVGINTSRTTYEIKYNKRSVKIENTDQDSLRELMIVQSTVTEFTNGRLKGGFGGNPMSEFDHIRFLNCLADMYRAGYNNPNLSPQTPPVNQAGINLS
ncbi:hypothetical protein HYZ82_00785 [Candidatus Nomurabacteria bacterium]|nr:hypothetical protein [Candidatus Nomurabacteria bacterium]